MRRVVITGLGIVSCLGNTKESVTDSLRNTKSGIRANESYREMGLRSQVSGSVDIDLKSLIDRKHLRFMGDAASYAYVSMQQAIEDAGLEILPTHPNVSIMAVHAPGRDLVSEFRDRRIIVEDADDLEALRDQPAVPHHRAADVAGADHRGVPRTVGAQDLAELLDQLGTPLDTAVLMDVDFDILLKRLTGRRTCSLTGKLLNVYFSPQEELDECTNAGGELIQREDDNEETIGNRLEVSFCRQLDDAGMAT